MKSIQERIQDAIQKCTLSAGRAPSKILIGHKEYLESQSLGEFIRTDYIDKPVELMGLPIVRVMDEAHLEAVVS